MAGAKSLVCRQIEERDLDAVAALLTQGFQHQRTAAFWREALRRLAAHETAPEMPRFGYLLEANEAIVGVILLIATVLRTGPVPFVRCNLSSWYVREKFRIYAPLLVSRALRHREATYFNLTAVPHTFPILRAQGFEPYCQGRLLAVAALARGPAGAEIMAAEDAAGLSEAEVAILRSHAGYGCVSVVCRHAGESHPFVFAAQVRGGRRGAARILPRGGGFRALCRSAGAVSAAAGLVAGVGRHGGADRGSGGAFLARQAEVLPWR